MKKVIIEAPVCTGSPTNGSQYAFGELISHGLKDILGADAVPMEHDLDVMEVGRRLYLEVSDRIGRGFFPVTIGGDHSCAMGTIAGASKALGRENITVVYLDGHTDINTEETSPTGFLHGMPLASAIGLCNDEHTVGEKQNIIGKNVFIVGARSIDEGEYGIIRENGVHLITASRLKSEGADRIATDIAGQITTPYVHVSFDVDFMDGDVFPSTGYRMSGGAAMSDAEAVLKIILKTGKVRSLDCVEYNPLLDRDGTDRGKLFRLLSLVAGI